MAAAVEIARLACELDTDSDSLLELSELSHGVRRVAAQSSKEQLSNVGGGVNGSSMDVRGSESSSLSSLVLSGSSSENSKREEWRECSSSMLEGKLLLLL